MIYKIQENERDYYFDSVEEMNNHFNDEDIILVSVDDTIVISSKGDHWVKNYFVPMTEEEVLKDLKSLADSNELNKLLRY